MVKLELLDLMEDKVKKKSSKSLQFYEDVLFLLSFSMTDYIFHNFQINLCQ